VTVGGAPVVILAGGTGGAKLARGMLDVVGADDLVVIANTGDDIEIYGSYVSPDPDLVTFWLADRIDERGWGLEGDSFAVMDGLRDLGHDVWFNLGDRDLAICLERARRLRSGERQTEAQQAITTALGVRARVLPMADQPIRTRVLADGSWSSLQEFLIRRRGQGEVQDVDFRGRAGVHPTAEVLAAIETARAIIIGPSNPVISIGPILSVAGLSDAITTSRAPTVAVSPIVHGAVVKGPTEAFMRWRGQSLNAAGIAAGYAPLLDGIVADESSSALPSLEIDTLMDTADRRRRLAENTLSFALGLT
jgi:LPPG:FO 2-phospho-L-lactate transferase